MAIVEKLKRIFTEDEAYYDDEYVDETERVVENTNEHAVNNGNLRPTPLKAVSTNNFPKHAANDKNSKIGILEPKIFSDSKAIAQRILQGEAVIVNFSKIEEDVAKRILDFVSGTVFAINGSIERIGEKIFVVTPETFEISGSPVDTIDNSMRF